MEKQGIEYRHNHPIEPIDAARLFLASGLARPTDDLPRIARMLAGANLVVSAWDAGRLIGVCRALSDHSWCCYISELAVDPGYQKRGIGASMIRRVRAIVGDGVSLILLSVPAAMTYYPKIGFTLADDAFVLKRRR